MFKVALKTISVLVFTTGIACAASAQNQAQVQSIYKQWVNALETAHGHPENIIKLYSPHAVLLATKEAVPIQDHKAMSEYFKKLTSLKDLKVVTKKMIIQDYGKTDIINGLYDFTYNDDQNKPQTLEARFTFVFEKIKNQWFIVDHHSSVLPK